MDRGLVNEKKARVRETIGKFLDHDKKVFIEHVSQRMGMSEKEFTDKFSINEMRMIRDADEGGNVFNVHTNVVVQRK